jgi:proline dehydrogenase
MLRSTLIYLSKADWARNMVMNWDFAWRAASRFIAGETLEDGIRAVRQLNAKGIYATLDHLGEHTTTPDEAKRATQDVVAMADAIYKAGVQSNISIKLTQIGMQVDEALCAENLQCILSYARQFGIFVRIDMEDNPWVDRTLGLYRKMRQEYGLDNTGVVIQAYLYRSEADVAQLEMEGTRVRLCKGAYKEPPEVAFPKKSDVDANYDKLTELLVDACLAHGSTPVSDDGRIPPIPAIASHDPERLAFAKTYAQSVGLPKGCLEFQMLYGIRRDLQEQAISEGYPVRVYVPFGSQWYPYYVRRLAERPSNVWFFVSNFFRK